MSKQTHKACPAGHAHRGFTLIELMITIALALFLVGGLMTIMQNVRQTYGNQQLLAQLQDTQRFAMGVITDVVQAGGYYPNPTMQTALTALPNVGATFQAGQAFYGTTGAGNLDTLQVRYRTAFKDQVILCDGNSNTVTNPDRVYTNAFSIVPPAGTTPGQLVCQVDDGTIAANAPGIAIASGVVGMQVWYGVKRVAPTTVDYNVDTYLTAGNMSVSDWSLVTAVKVRLTFTNPLFPQAGQQQFLTFERVIPVMGRSGIHT